MSIVGDEFVARDIQTIRDDEFNIRGTFEDENRAQNGESNGMMPFFNHFFVKFWCFLGIFFVNFFLEQIVVPTPDALAHNLHEIKLIVADTKIKTIVTNITIDGLDQMKKDSKEAREATR